MIAWETIMKLGLEGINLYNPLEGKLDKVIDYFVEFYGEQFREKIEERLKNTIFIFVDRLNAESSPIKLYFEYVNNNKLKEIEGKLRDKGILMTFNTFDIEKQMEEMKMLQKKNFIDLDENDKKFLKQFDTLASKDDLEEHFKSDDNKIEFINYFEKINSILNEDYNELCEKIKLGYIDENAKNKNNKLFLSQCANLFGKALIKYLNIDPTIENKKEIIKYVPLINKYLLREHKALLRGEFEEFDVNIFKGLLQLSDKFKDSSIENVLGIFDMCKDKFINLYEDKMAQEYILKAGLGQKVEDIKNKYFMGDYEETSIKDFITQKCSMSKGFTILDAEKANPNKIASIIVVNSYMGLSDDVIIHEMNHAVSTNSSFSNNKLHHKIGIHKYDYNVLNGDVTAYNEDYGSLNEVFTEYTAQKIVKKMHEDNFKIGYFDHEGVSYRIAFSFLEEFFEENMKELIDIYTSEDIDTINKYFDREEFDGLTKLIKELFDTFMYVGRERFQDIQYEISTFVKTHNCSIFEIASRSDINFSKYAKIFLDFAKKIKVILDKIKLQKIEDEKDIDLDLISI